MGDHAQFEVLMRSLMSEKNDERKAAEAQFEALVRTPPQAAPLMCTAMAACSDHTVRSMTTIMFRKRVDKAFFEGLDLATQVGLGGLRRFTGCRVPPVLIPSPGSASASPWSGCRARHAVYSERVRVAFSAPAPPRAAPPAHKRRAEGQWVV
jgi:hypothetical protein